jgi:hypothetical protein
MEKFLRNFFYLNLLLCHGRGMSGGMGPVRCTLYGCFTNWPQLVNVPVNSMWIHYNVRKCGG